MLAEAVEAAYGIRVGALTFLPLGADSASASYRVDDIDGASYFVKVRACSGFSPASLLVPLHLQQQGVPHLLAPLPTRAEVPWVALDRFTVALFPFVKGRIGAHAGLSERHWKELGATVGQIHATQLPPELVAILPHERFIPSRRPVVTRLQEVIAQQVASDPLSVELAEFWNARRDQVRALIRRADELASRLRARSGSLVLCHADLHTWNILLGSDEHLWLVDWDETILARRERDLMFVVVGIGRDLVSPRQTACFLQGYGEVDIDPEALTYYRYAWAVQDLAAYGEQVLLLPGLGEATRRDALEGLKSLFEPGNIVEIAFGSDRSG